MNIILGQFHTELIFPSNESYDFNIWNRHREDGYYKPSEFWELPLWIGRLTALLKYNNIQPTLKIYDSIPTTTNYNADYVCFSVLEVNKSLVLQEIKSNPNQKYLLGGYIDSNVFNMYPNVHWCNSVEEFSKVLKLKYVYKVDWSLFKGYYCIPRITLSTGCKHKCSFCTIEKTIVEISEEEIYIQIEALKVLNFKLVYIDDKTFGQAKNHTMLEFLYEKIRKFNHKFKGFIIQTTTRQVFNLNLQKLHIFAVELGIETYNNFILKALHKPSSEKLIQNAVDYIYKLGSKVILNIVIGFTQETVCTYYKTIQFIQNNKNKVYFLNVYNLAIYQDTEMFSEILQPEDTMELIPQKSFNSNSKNTLNTSVYNYLLQLYF